MLSSAVTSGTPTLASQYNNLRLDAIALTETVTAGEVFAATTPVTIAGVNQGYSLPTLLYESGGQWFKMPGNTTNGARLRVAMAYEASGAIGASVRIYMPGSLVPVTGGSPATADYGRNVSNSNTAGATELTVRPNFYTHIGFLINASYFMFQGPIYNNVFSKQIESPVVAGEAFSVRDILYIKVSDGKAYKAVSTSLEPGYAKGILIAAQAATAADQVILVYTPGAVITGFSSLNPGVTYYTSGTAGGLSSQRSGFSKPVGYALDATTLIFLPGKEAENLVIETVIAGENWTLADLLYQKSDGSFYRSDADVAESGILERPAIAFATHSGGASSRQLVYMPGSIIRSVFAISAAIRYYPSATTGAYQAGSPASLDTFFRQAAYSLEANVMHLQPQEMIFLPTGIQEKGFMAAGGYNEASVTQAGKYGHSGVNFKKVMVNTPSSITATSVNSLGSSLTPTASDITRFGFKFRCQTVTGTGEYYWSGYYTTVGN